MLLAMNRPVSGLPTSSPAARPHAHGPTTAASRAAASGPILARPGLRDHPDSRERTQDGISAQVDHGHASLERSAYALLMKSRRRMSRRIGPCQPWPDAGSNSGRNQLLLGRLAPRTLQDL